MPIIQMVQGPVRDAKVSWRGAARLRVIAALAGVVGLTAGACLFTSGSALASSGSEPGNLILSPASGPNSLRPTWSTRDGCPVGYQGSAQLSEFNTNGTYASAISSVIQSPVAPFHGTLLGNIGAILGVTDIAKGKTVVFAIGCYSLIAGTGKVKYVQSTDLTLSSAGGSFSTSAGNGQSGSSSSSAQSSSASTGGGSTQLEAALIAGACGLLVATGGVVWYRRRNRGRLS